MVDTAATGSMRPLDPRLLRTASAVRTHLLVAIGCGAALTGLILLQAWLVSRVISDATEGAGLEELALVIAAVAAVAVTRAGLAYGSEAAALRSAAKAKSQLRMQLVEQASPTANAGEVVTLATRGLDALDDYFARYLPQLVLAVLVPVAVLVVVAGADWISGVVIAVTLPLIPLFMALVGMHTQARTARQWSLLERLGGHFLDVVEGLPTLALFRRAKAEAALVRKVTEQHREATMGTLRVAFLSAFVLEVLATLAVALVAVEIGFRLLWGDLPLSTALFVLILAPEAYLPLREVGARFHASMEGIAAAQKVFAVLDSAPAAASGTAPAPRGDIRLHDVSVVHPERTALSGLSVVLPRGRTTVVTGPSGAGKSTILNLLLGFTVPTAGRVTVGDTDLSDVDLAAWRRELAWVPQHPHLFDDTLADNIRLEDPDATLDQVRRAAHLAELDEVIAGLPEGLDTRLGERGTRLSSGQRQRVALARAFLRAEKAPADGPGAGPIVLLDEPTAHLDPDNAATVRRAVQRLTQGRTAVIVTHDPAWTAADHHLPLSPHLPPTPLPTVPPPPPRCPERHSRDIPRPESAVRAEAGDPHRAEAGDPHPAPAPAPAPATAPGTAPAPAPATAPAPAPATAASPTPPERHSRGIPRPESAVRGSGAGAQPKPARRGGLRRMLGLARPRGARFLLGVLLGAVATASGVGLLSLAAWLIATAATHPPVTALSIAVVLTRALGVTRGVARYLERLVTHDAALRTLADARDRVYARLAATEPVRRFRSGDLVSRLVSDTDATQDLLVRGLTPPLSALLVGGGVVALATALLTEGGLLLLGGLLLAGVAVPLLAARLSRGPARRAATARADLATGLVDTLHGAPDLLAYGAMGRARATVGAADAALTRTARRDAAILGLGAGATALIAGLTLWGSLLLGVAAVTRGDLAPIPLAVLVLTALAAFEIVAPLPAAAARLGAIRESGDRLFAVLDTPPATAPADPTPVSSAPADLRIRGLRAGYGDAPDAACEVLHGIDLDVPAGAHVAVVGPSGAGKSTLAAVLFRFMDATGEVRLGDVDLLRRSPDAVRAAVGGVPQDPHVFDSTVRENLRLARPDATDAELLDVLGRVRLELGLDELVGTHGHRLSGGMRQRLALARALLTDPALLVLDEPTAHLDPATRDAVLDDLLTAAAGRSTLLITHDHALLDRMDRVVDIRDGRVQTPLSITTAGH